MRQPPRNKKETIRYNVNGQIRALAVRVVGDDIAPTIMDTRDALRLAREKELDLVEISPNAEPPVCRICDYSKFLYQQKKRQKEIIINIDDIWARFDDYLDLNGTDKFNFDEDDENDDLDDKDGLFDGDL